MSRDKGSRQDHENRLSRWSRLKRKRAAGEDVKELDADADETGGGPARVRGAASPRVEPDGTGQMAMVDGKPYMPPLAGPETEADGTDVAVKANVTVEAEEEDSDPELTPAEAEAIKDLPAIEDLNADSDFTAFLSDKVPEFIRRKALRKLWLSDPAFSFLDGMNEYDEDYSVIVELAANATDYKPGEGGYGWRDKPKGKDREAVPDDAPEEGLEPTGKTKPAASQSDGQAEEPASGRVAGHSEMSFDERAKKIQDRGGSSVRAPEYTSNPYYQDPGRRNPIPADLEPVETVDLRDGDAEDPVDWDDDDVGDGEDDMG